MDGVTIGLAGPADIALLDGALRALAGDLGDAYRADEAVLTAALCGPDARCLGLLARRGDKALGAVLAAPVFSTLRGGAGLFVSDLWTAPAMRGQGLARRMLAQTLREGAKRGLGGFIKLTVYHDNPGARAVYDRLGFAAQSGETNMVLTGQALTTLRESQ